MNKQTKRGIFYVLVFAQLLWWIKVAFTEDTKADKPFAPDVQLEVKDGWNIDQRTPKKTHFDALKFHIQKVKRSSSVNRSDVMLNENSTNSLELPKVKPPAFHFQVNETFGENEMSLSKDEIFRRYYNKLLKHTILPMNFSVLNGNYTKNPSNVCTRHRELDLLIIVHTKPYHFVRRENIRNTLANSELIHPYTVQPVFFVGVMPESEKDLLKEHMIEEESQHFGDLVQMAFDENFRNLSLKAVLWLKWTNEHCQNAFMILKIDDDVVLDIFKVAPLSRGLFSKYKRSIFCYVNKRGTQPIPRKGRTKVDPREFLDVFVYPYMYCSGFIVFLTPDLIPLLTQTLQQVPFYNVDDVFMFGMVPKFIGHVTYHNLGYNVSIWHEKVYKCTVERGKLCPYFGTMAEHVKDRERVWQAMMKHHSLDFKFPQIRLP